jgi:outer membrane receptor protein involved in Fe transport
MELLIDSNGEPRGKGNDSDKNGERTKMKRFLQYVTCILAVLLVTASLNAQITGDLRGVVLDTSGAAVPGAKVTLTSLETGEQRTANSDAEGRFMFGLLRVGNYELKAEASGFRVAVTQAEVKTGEIASVQFRLEVGQMTEVITVTDAVTQLDTENSQIQTSVVGQSIQEIPVGRNPNLFALTAPGVAPVSANNPFLGSGSFNSNGGRGRGNNITVDGITATDVSVTGTGGVLTPLNFSSIKEVKVITNNFSAEYGRNSSSQVVYLTKNGTNELHGELFEYFRNDKLDARPFFDTTGRAAVNRYNEYGWAIGGPVFLPGLFDGRNKAFFFTDFYQIKQRGAGATRIANVPTPDMIAQVTDPTSRALMEQYNLAALATPTGRLETAAPNRSDVTQFSVRGDVNLTSKDTIWARYSRATSAAASSGLTFIGTNIPGFGATSENRPDQATAQYVRLLSPTAVNEFRFGYGHSEPAFPIDTPFPLGPRISIASGEVMPFGVWEGLPQGRSQDTFQFTDNLTFVRGRHNFKAGGEYYYLRADSFFDALIRGFYQFPTWADFAAGRPLVAQQRFGDSVRNNRVTNAFAFFQDDWKVTRNLTLNLGVRYEFAGGPTEANGRISNLNLDNRTAFGAAGAGRWGLLETGRPSFRSNHNWAPRLGFAWNVGGSQKMVVRGGYGIAYDFIFLNPITNQRFLPPFIVTGVLTGQASFTGDNSWARFIAGNARMQEESRAQVGQLSPTVLNWGNISPAIDQGLRNPQVHQWNFGVQRELMGLILKGSYVGTKGNFLQRSRDINLIANPVAPATSLADEQARLSEFQAAFAGLSGSATRYSNRIDPRYNAIVLVDSSANSNYHAAQFEVQKRFSRGYMFNANYTFGKSIDDGSDVLGVLINDSPNQQDPLNNRDNRAPSQFDLRHRFVITHQWELPWGKGSSNWFVRSILAGWSFAGITSFRSGFPVTLDAGPRLGLNPLTVLGGGAQVRPNVVGPVNFDPRPAGSEGSPFGATGGISNYATALGLSQPLLGNFGTMGRNVLRLNGERNFDWNVYKNFAVTESTYFQVRCEMYNVFNNTSFQEINRVITNPNFGQYTTVGQNARWLQLAARFVF